MNELKIVNESEYTGEETSPAITFVNSEDGSRVVFAGSIAEYGKINNQEKSVEITESGVTEIVPDKGYTGLSKVSVDTSAISGGSGEGGGSNWRYFAVYDDAKMYEFSMCSSLIKVDDSAMGIQILSSAGTNFLENFSLLAMAYDMNRAIYLTGPEGVVFTTVGDMIEYILGNVGAGMDYLGAEITEEEFYRIPDTSHDGYYIQHIDGTLYTADQWTNGGFSNDEANGVAAIDGLSGVSLVVAKDKFDPMPWSSMPDTLIEDIFTADWNAVLTMNFGIEPTAIIAAADPNSVAAACMNYTFPNGQKGYLPSAYEAFSVASYDDTVKNLMSLIGRNDFGDINEEYMWTSTQYDAEEAYTQRYYGMNREQSPFKKELSNSYFPVCTLENYKFPTA